MMRGRVAGWGAVVCAGLLLLVPAGAMARQHDGGGGGADHAGIFRTLEIGPDETAGDVACLFCTVRVAGDVRGDVAVLFSTLEVEPGREIGGDVAGLFSTLRLGAGSRVHGDLTWTLGATTFDPAATVDGDRVLFGGSSVGWLVLVAPVLIVLGVVWLLVWVVRQVL